MRPLARRLVRAVAAVLRPAAKCIVLDLDNTIWGGVIGDDGPGGIKLGDDYPGSVFKDFQAALLGYRRRGFLLAIASKNDADVVRDAIDHHPEMVLRSEHFAAMEINWEPKPASLRRIAETLNIGLDSLVFLDDNPVERAEVRAELPMVEVVELSARPVGLLAGLARRRVARSGQAAGRGPRRAEMYRQEAIARNFGRSKEASTISSPASKWPPRWER